MYIYKTTNKVNGKLYIGQSVLPYNTIYLGSGNLIKLAIRKYGRNAFTKKLLEECTTQEELDSREKFWIAYYSSTERSKGYNISIGGEHSSIEKIKGNNHYLYKMSEADRDAYLNKYVRGENFWKRKGIFTEEAKQEYLATRYPMLDWRNRFNSREEYRAWVKTTNRGCNLKTPEHIEAMKGKNNPIFRGKTDEEIETWLNENRRGENSPNVRYEYSIEKSDGVIITTKCLATTCKKYGFNLHVLRKLMELNEGVRLEYVPRIKEYIGWKVSKKKLA